MKIRLLLLLSAASLIALSPVMASAQHQKKQPPPIQVPSAAPSGSRPVPVYDRQFGVRFEVPPGWSYNRRDGQVSTFHLDAHSAPASAQLRGVANIEFNPYPQSSFSGAIFYYSVQRHTTDAACERQASALPNAEPARPALKPKGDAPPRDVQSIGGMNFAHGHDQKGRSCVEQRDEIYTAFRHGSCYRFDLAVNTFCGSQIGVPDLSDSQVEQIDARMADILSTVALDWSRSGPEHVDAPHPPDAPDPPRPAPVAAQSTGR